MITSEIATAAYGALAMTGRERFNGDDLYDYV